MSGRVQAIYCQDIDAVQATPGAFEYYMRPNFGVAGIIYNCPCGCGRVGSLNFEAGRLPRWSWDGNQSAPTLTPSVHHIIGGETHWHG
jgi:hypothetical protein